MKILYPDHGVRDARDAAALLGSVTDMALLAPVYFGAHVLAVPALAVLVPSLMYGMR